jgi:hypothetical protein
MFQLPSSSAAKNCQLSDWRLALLREGLPLVPFVHLDLHLAHALCEQLAYAYPFVLVIAIHVLSPSALAASTSYYDVAEYLRLTVADYVHQSRGLSLYYTLHIAIYIALGYLAASVARWFLEEVVSQQLAECRSQRHHYHQA